MGECRKSTLGQLRQNSVTGGLRFTLCINSSVQFVGGSYGSVRRFITLIGGGVQKNATKNTIHMQCNNFPYKGIMKNTLLLVVEPTTGVRFAGQIPIQNQARFEELILGDEQVLATFECRNLTVMLKTGAGSTIILKGGKYG